VTRTGLLVRQARRCGDPPALRSVKSTLAGISRNGFGTLSDYSWDLRLCATPTPLTGPVPTANGETGVGRPR